MVAETPGTRGYRSDGRVDLSNGLFVQNNVIATGNLVLLRIFLPLTRRVCMYVANKSIDEVVDLLVLLLLKPQVKACGSIEAVIRGYPLYVGSQDVPWDVVSLVRHVVVYC